MQTNLNGETLTITSGSKSRNYTIVRGQENVLTDGHFTAGWTRYRDGWTNVTDLNLTSINSGYNTLLTNIKENIFSQTEYPKILENLQFEFTSTTLSTSNAETSEIEVNFDGVNEYLTKEIIDNPNNGSQLLKKLASYEESSFVENGWDVNSLLANEVADALAESLDAEVVLTDVNKMSYSVDGKLYTIGSLAGTGSTDFILGTNADDSISGGNSNDEIRGGEGDDKLYGNAHNDTLEGGSGDDYLRGGTQSDTLSGGEGNDTLVGDGEGSSHHQFWNRGHDTLEGGEGNDTLIGGYGRDTYIFNKGDGVDTIHEVSRNDYYQRNWGNRYGDYDTVKFGEGIAQEDITLNIDGKDLLVGFKGSETDQIILKDFMNNNTLNTFEFADGTKLGRGGFMNLDGGTYQGIDSDDSYSFYESSETFHAGEGDDVISGNSGEDKLYGEAGNDNLSGGNQNDYLDGGIGEDTLSGGNHNDTLVGGEGNDKLYGNAHNDTLEGGSGDDYLRGGTQSDTLSGGEGNDTLVGDGEGSSHHQFWNRGHDTLEGGEGNDTLIGGYGKDTYLFNKGDGVDTIHEVSRNDYYQRNWGNRYGDYDTVKFGEGIAQEDITLNIDGKDLLVGFKGSETDQLVLKDFMLNNTINTFEFADGTKLDRNNFMSLDVLEGTDEADSISGYGGAETILAGAGDDSIRGNSGDDELYGESGDDTLSGGNNNDTLDGGEGNDKLYGNNHNDSLDGGAGDDQLYGGSQSDTLIGGEGNDTLIGDNITTSSTSYGSRSNWSSRYNEIRYNKGNDILAGGKGDDSLAGGYGSDTYIFNKGDGVDTITEMLVNDYVGRSYDRNARDTIKFGEGLNQEDVELSLSGQDLLVNFKGNDTDQLVLKDFMRNNTINNFEFADGSILSKSDFMSLDALNGTDDADTRSLLDGNEIYYAGLGDDTVYGNSGNDTLFGESGNDILSGGNHNDTLDGGEGNDKLYGNNHDDSLDGGVGDDYLHGGSQSDTLIGGEGNDTLIGDNITTSSTSYGSRSNWSSRYNEIRYNKGNDILAGGKGDDTLAGGYGSDTYIFNKGDGVDTITEMLVNDYVGRSYDSSSRDTVKFGEGIEASDLNFAYDGNDVHVSFKGSDTDKLILKNFQGSTLDKFEFANGDVLSKSDITIGTEIDDVINASSGNSLIYAGSGKDVINMGSGNDTVNAGDGDDIINASSNNIEFNKKEFSGKASSSSIKTMFDVNNDGLADLVEQESGETFVSLSNGTSLEGRKKYSDFESISRSANQNITPEFDTDINGDGIQDKVKFDITGVHTALGQEDGSLSAMSNVYAAFGRDAGGWSTNNTFPRHMADVNGDGMADIVGFASTGVYTALSKGDGSFATAQKAHGSFGTRAGGWVSNDRFPRFVTDVNGDGMADVVGFGNTHTYIALSKGDGTFGSTKSLSTGFNYQDGWTSNSSYQRLMADIDGDGKSDIIGINSAGDIYTATTAKQDNDIVDGGDGNDTITGGQGDDILVGGAGSDTYNYSSGDGNDIINLAGDGSTDILKLNDISKDDILFSRSVIIIDCR